ncbi:MAG: allophanate hydrolase, partial [Candidatus Methylumidiphilus sp.]
RCTNVEADPIQLNTNMGYYTYFANPLHLCAVSVPAGLRPDRLAFGLNLIAGPWREKTLHLLGQRFHLATGGCLGATATMLESVQ